MPSSNLSALTHDIYNIIINRKIYKKMIKSGLEEWLYANANVRYNEVHEPRSDQITVIVEWTTKKKMYY